MLFKTNKKGSQLFSPFNQEMPLCQQLYENLWFWVADPDPQGFRFIFELLCSGPVGRIATTTKLCFLLFWFYL
jgi:hypothetical protein